MTTIKRFTPDYKMHAVRFEAFAREAEHGEYVRFDAHQQTVSALEAERDALAQRVEMLAHNLGNAIWGEQEALQQVNALAVDNAALKSRSIKLFNLGYLRGHESTVEGYFVDVHRSDIDTYHDDVVAEIIEDEGATPATDAALAAIQAQGVEKFADFLGKQYQCEKANSAKGKAYKHVVFLACRFINELREAK